MPAGGVPTQTLIPPCCCSLQWSPLPVSVVRTRARVAAALVSSLEAMITAVGVPSVSRIASATWVPSQGRTSFAKERPSGCSATSIPWSIFPWSWSADLSAGTCPISPCRFNFWESEGSRYTVA